VLGRVRYVMAAFAAVLVVATSTCVASASSLTGPGGAVHGCVSKHGVLAVIGYKHKCPRHTTSIIFGKQGAGGATGLPGATGAAGANGVHGIQGVPGTPADASEVNSLQTQVNTLNGEVSTLTSANSALQALLAGVTRSGNLLTFSGMNLQLNSGAGTTSSAVNGLGNLFIGYNDSPGTQTGSNNLVIGDEHSFTSYGGLVAGEQNTLTAPYSAIIGGFNDTASGAESAVSGGEYNIAGDPFSMIGGGCDNITGAGTANTNTCDDGGEGDTGGKAIAGTANDSTSGAISDGLNYAGTGTVGLTNLVAGGCTQFPISVSGLKVGDVVSLAFAATPPPAGLVLIPLGVHTAGQALVNACNVSTVSITWASVVRILSMR
jgi:hypothetical protein